MTESLSHLSGKILSIIQQSIWKNNFEFKYDEELLGKIIPRNVFSFGLFITIGEAEWEIYKPNFWKSDIAVREKGRENPFASYNKKFFSREGTVFLPKGQRLIIKSGNFKRKYGVFTASGICLASIKDEVSFKARSLVYIESSSELLDKYPWVIILAWYLKRKRKQTAAAG